MASDLTWSMMTCHCNCHIQYLLQCSTCCLPPYDSLPTYHSGESVSGNTVVGQLQRLLPGLQEIVNCPAEVTFRCKACTFSPAPCPHDDKKMHQKCSDRSTVQRVIVHLNDSHRWTRSAVADWLDTLDVDLTFPTEEPPALPEADPAKVLFIVAPTMAMAQGEARRRQRSGTPPRWQYLSNRLAHANLQRVRGHYRPQYVTVGGYLNDWIAEILESVGAVEVGEEPRAADLDGALKMLQAAYQPQIQALLNDEAVKWSDLTWGNPAADPIEDLKEAMALAKKAAYNSGPVTFPLYWHPWVEPTFDPTPHAHDHKTVALQHKKQQAEHQQHLKHNPTKSKPTK